MKKELRPVLDGHWKLIGPAPDLSGRLNGDEAHRIGYEKGEHFEHNAPVDHHMYADSDGT